MAQKSEATIFILFRRRRFFLLIFFFYVMPLFLFFLYPASDTDLLHYFSSSSFSFSFFLLLSLLLLVVVLLLPLLLVLLLLLLLLVLFTLIPTPMFCPLFLLRHLFPFLRLSTFGHLSCRLLAVTQEPAASKVEEFAQSRTSKCAVCLLVLGILMRLSM